MNIEKYLVLNKYLLSLIGVDEFRELQERLKETSEGDDPDGRSYFINSLRSLDNLKVSEDTLLLYDNNIRLYVDKINRRREPKIQLRYFQFLSLIFAEIFLDNIKNRKTEFLYELNEFLKNYKQQHDIGIIDEFTEDDLRKLAFWMATGSGKTLIMHINYHQFFHYKPFNPDNIVLITPNEGLSKQHFEELEKSGITCRLFTGGFSGLYGSANRQGVLVLEITKLVDEKKGGGVTIPLDVFEGNNLVFVDEGHKGKLAEEQKWKRLRDKLADKGFTFEYSATFGQILSERNPEILKEYAKAIVFDYSYKYFYLDGYGKDFSVFNVARVRISEKEFQETMFAANLLAFYEQLLIYENHKSLAREFNIEKPLWIFVGTTVTGREEEADVIQIVEFLRKAIQDQKWLEVKTTKIIKGNSGLNNDDGKDVFNNKFEYLKKNDFDLQDVYRLIFCGKGEFAIHDLKNAEGELGLKVGENNYFGVVNIGDVSDFKKILEKKKIIAHKDMLSSSLFDDIKREESNINILIGSKKFIEGWDTWRVSSMGLLNIGTGQGPQIIQLFGRGVRLKGKGFSLKRSGRSGPIGFLEYLNIYGIKADYLSKFLKAIRKEDVEFETIEIPVQPQNKEKWSSLNILSRDENKRFEEENILPLAIDERLSVSTIDLSPKIKAYHGIQEESVIGELEEAHQIPPEFVDSLNWQRILLDIYEYKIIKGYLNLVFNRKTLENILYSNRYKIIAPAGIFSVKHREDFERIQNVALLVIKKYIDNFYRKYRGHFETKHMQYGNVTPKQLRLFVSESGDHFYTVQIKKTDEKGKPINRDLIRKIGELAKNLDELTKQETEELPRVYFDKHLYLPILLQSSKIEKISPAPLEKSEGRFIKDMKGYLKANRERFKEHEVYLLRNFPKSGVGFQLQWAGFYPDFIMWIKKGAEQLIVFIDPHGLEHVRSLKNEKIKFAGFLTSEDDPDTITIKRVEKGLGNKDIRLESFILSPTKYEDLKKGDTSHPSEEDYKNHHVLFLDDKKWTEELFDMCFGKV